MDLDFITKILLLIVLIYLAYSRVKMYNEHQQALEVAKERKDMKKIFTGQLQVMIYAVVMVASIIAVIIIYLNKAQIEDSTSWLLACGVFFTTAAIDLIRVNIMYTTYYNDHGMFINQDYIRYNSIKDFTQKKVPINTQLHTFNGQTHVVPTRTLRILKDKIIAKQKK